jgi:imidazole glycerol phosphate synthase glutamine amidotransferase subunit
MIAIVDYGMGNLRSVTNAFRMLGGDVVVTRKKETIRTSKAVVLPGVGAFGKCIENLKNFELFDLIKDLIMNDKRYLGICLGMQTLFESSEEAPGIQGMGVIKGDVPRFTGNIKVPHMGWNSIEIQTEGNIFRGINNGEFFYFVHSYYCRPIEDITATKTTYGVEFTSSIQRGRLFACQFHPEKSQQAGLKLLQNFIDICK